MPILEESPRKKILPPPADVRPALLGFHRNDQQNSTPHPVDAAPPPPAAPFPEPLCEARGVLFRIEKPTSLSAMKFPPTALSIQGKRRNPSPHEDLFVKIGLGVFITLTSPIWIPLWILLLPFKRRREGRKREEHLAQAALQAKMPPPPPPPPTDPELLRRRELARQTNKHTHPKIRHFYDPIRDDPDIGPIIKAAAERAHQEVSGGKYEHLGTCHLIWRRQKEILKEEHGITWYSPPLVSG